MKDVVTKTILGSAVLWGIVGSCLIFGQYALIILLIPAALFAGYAMGQILDVIKEDWDNYRRERLMHDTYQPKNKELK